MSAVARTWPFLTGSPTLTLTSVAVHVVEPLAAAAVVLARCAGEPNARPYEALEATLPVAATSSVTSPVATGAGQVLGRRGLAGRQPADGHDGGPDADHGETDDGEDLELHECLPRPVRLVATAPQAGALRTLIWRRDSETGMRNRRWRAAALSARAGTWTAGDGRPASIRAWTSQPTHIPARTAGRAAPRPASPSCRGAA